MKHSNIRFPRKTLTGLGLILIFLSTSPFGHSATVAFDAASDVAYNNGWQNGDNGGSGWGGGWNISVSPSSFFMGDSASNGGGDTPPLGDINTNGRAWGVKTTANLFAAFRPFNGALSVGQTFMIDFDTGFVDPGGTSGFSLITSTGADLLRFRYVGGSANYTVDAGSVTGSVPAFTDQGLHVEVTLTSPGNYSMSIKVLGGQSTIVTGALLDNNLPIEAIQIYNQPIGQGIDHNSYFNNIAIVPEPSTNIMLAIGVTMFAQRLRRRGQR